MASTQRRRLRRRCYARTDVGRCRAHNEDAFVADDTLGLYIVADGVGGGPAGEVASAEAAQQVRSFVAQGFSAVESWLALPGSDEEGADYDLLAGERLRALRRLLESAVQSACYFVKGIAEQDPAEAGMSTTLSALLVAGDHAIVAQVGDSRVYHHREKVATQITDDHTLVNHQLKRGLVTPEEAKTMKGRNLITRSVGKRDWVEVDTFDLALRPGDHFLVCSDGLHNYLRPGEVEDLLGARSMERATAMAIELANERGGQDNITAIAVALRD